MFISFVCVKRPRLCQSVKIIFISSFVAEENGPELPTRANEEFRPFIRRLPEFKFWYSVTKSTLIGLVCTFFECFNIPVFWPILVMYFITLFCITMKRQIRVSFTLKVLSPTGNNIYCCSIWSNINTYHSLTVNPSTRVMRNQQGNDRNKLISNEFITKNSNIKINVLICEEVNVWCGLHLTY